MQGTRFNSWVRKTPWRRAWLPTPVFLPGESHGQKSLAGHSPWGHKELDLSEQLTLGPFGRIYLIFLNIFHVNRRYTCYKICMCFSLINLFWCTYILCLSQESRRLKEKLFLLHYKGFFWVSEWKFLSCVWLFAIPWTIQFMVFSRPEYWSGWPFPSPRDRPNPGIEPRSPALKADSSPTELSGKPYKGFLMHNIYIVSQPRIQKAKGKSISSPL